MLSTVSSLKGMQQNTSIYNNAEKAHKKLITRRYYSTQMLETFNTVILQYTGAHVKKIIA